MMSFKEWLAVKNEETTSADIATVDNKIDLIARKPLNQEIEDDSDAEIEENLKTEDDSDAEIESDEDLKIDVNSKISNVEKI